MGSKYLHQKKAKPTLALRSFGLKQAFPLSVFRIKRGSLYWKGVLQPTVLSSVYEVEIKCKENRTPEVWVNVGDDPDIESIPHKYSTDKENNRVQACLFLPREYDPGWRFRDTIVPWVIEWLYFYEIWLITGKWCGGGQHSIQ